MKALDLYCKAGGNARGLAVAGFEVVGVDIEPQPNYPYEFHQDDAFTFLRELAAGRIDYRFDLIWASPPCLDNTNLRHAPNAKQHEDLIAPTRELLEKTGLPWVIENVESPRSRERMRDPVVLCGSMFDLGVEIPPNDWWFQLRRHRLFESNFPIEQLCCDHTSPVIGIYGGHARCRSKRFGGRGTVDFPEHDRPHLVADALGLPRDCMTMDEYSNAIPPAYAEHIGRCALKHIRGEL